MRRPRDNATNPPYHSEKLDIEFNMRVIESLGMPARVDNPAIKKIGVVGALFDKDYNVLDRDLMSVTDALRMLRQAQISMASLVKFHFYNLLAPISSDFLAASLLDNCAPKADALIVCDIHHDRSGRNNFAKLRYDQQVTPYDNLEWDYLMNVDFYQEKPRWVGVSHIQTQMEEAWGRCADLVDAKLVFIHESGDAIETKDFMAGGFFQTVVGNQENIPGISLGVAVSNAHLAELQAQVTPDHIVGKRILDLTPGPLQRATPLLEMK